MLSSLLKVFASETDLEVDLELVGEPLDTPVLFAFNDVLLEGALLVLLNEINKFLLLNFEMLSCPFSIIQLALRLLVTFI